MAGDRTLKCGKISGREAPAGPGLVPGPSHQLRHACGYALANHGVDTRTLQAFMGHRSIANTVIYTAVADKRIRHIWDR
jgi:site-specific recombinase XerD